MKSYILQLTAQGFYSFMDVVVHYISAQYHSKDVMDAAFDQIHLQGIGTPGSSTNYQYNLTDMAISPSFVHPEILHQRLTRK